MTRFAFALPLVGAVLAACHATTQPGDPLPGLSQDERARFEAGRTLFDSVFTPQTGLGPLFNQVACGECHEDPKAGGRGDEVEIHVAVFKGGVCDPLADQGGPVIQQMVTPALRAALGIDKEPVPPEATVQAHRTTPVIFGRGLLDAVPDSEILAYADPGDRDGDGISGRPNRSPDGRVGRFGRKALTPTLAEFNAGAFVVEQGITNPAVPTEETVGGRPIPPGVDSTPDPEINQAALDHTDDFVRFLAIPSPGPDTGNADHGRKLFSQIGCDRCHRPQLVTGPSPVKALDRVTFAAYTDLLLHDMGPDLADICLGLAQPSEFRTEPLIGLRFVTAFMHDGRATTLEQAIELHGGEATRSRDLFKALPQAERAALLAFLGTL